MKRSILALFAATLVVALVLPLAAHAAPANKSTPDAKVWSNKSSTGMQASASTPSRMHRHHRGRGQMARVARVDLNTATREQLMSLPGIDAATADKIIADRPFTKVSQLETKKVVNRSEYRKVRARLTVSEKLSSNTQPRTETKPARIARAERNEHMAKRQVRKTEQQEKTAKKS